MKLLNSENFEFFFKQYYSWLCSVSFSIIKDRDAAEDVVQELFTSLWNNKDSLSINGDIKYYLARAVKNRSLNYLRDKKHFEEIDILGGELKLADNNAQKEMEYYELMDSVQKVISDLPEKCREVFTLSRYEKKSYKEIAIYLKISEKTVENQISKALKILRKKLKNYISVKVMLMYIVFISFFHSHIGDCLNFSVLY